LDPQDSQVLPAVLGVRERQDRWGFPVNLEEQGPLERVVQRALRVQ